MLLSLVLLQEALPFYVRREGEESLSPSSCSFGERPSRSQRVIYMLTRRRGLQGSYNAFSVKHNFKIPHGDVLVFSLWSVDYSHQANLSSNDSLQLWTNLVWLPSPSRHASTRICSLVRLILLTMSHLLTISSRSLLMTRQ